jgi:hypothetical protein
MENTKEVENNGTVVNGNPEVAGQDDAFEGMFD